MKKFTSIFLTLILATSIVFFPQIKSSAQEDKVRAVWVSTVFNIDWPSDSSKGNAQAQKNEFVRMLDRLKSAGINTIMLQVRPESDAFYKSKINPWSRYLTGVQGRDIGYDPLSFAINETHKRGMKLHAWFNPYRASIYPDKSSTSPDNPMNIHPDWVINFNKKWYYDPGKPEVTQYIVDTIKEVAENYDIDGVHFDDYFYPGPAFPDSDTFAKYGSGNIDNWRRNNINNMVKRVHDMIQQTKPKVKFGISPAGIWRNKKNDHNGSNTNGGESYAKQYADTRYWIKNGLIDYVVPQVYWRINHPKADYRTLIKWWSDQVKNTNVELYIGEGIYKHGQKEYAGENVAAEIKEQLRLNRQHKEIAGEVFFSAKDLLNIPQVYNDVRNFYLSEMNTKNSNNTSDNKSEVNDNSTDKNYRAPYQSSLAGKDRSETAIAISKKSWPKGSENAILVNGKDIVSGIVVAPLAAKYNAPILLSYMNKVSESTIQEMNRLGVKNLFVFGNNGAITESEINEVKAKVKGINITKVFSDNIAESSSTIAKMLSETKEIDNIYVASENAAADVLSIASFAAHQKNPIIIVGKNSITKENEEWIKSPNVKNVYVIGGDSTISKSLVDKLNNISNGKVTRIFGANRIETNTKVIEKLYTDKFYKKAFITNSTALIDAITVSSFAQKSNSPIVLVGNTVDGLQKSVLNPKSASLVYRIGGKVSNQSYNEMLKLFTGLMMPN